MANNVVEYFIRAKDETHKALGTASANIASFAKGVFHNLMNIKAGFDMAFGVIRTAANAFYGAIKEAFKFESQTIQFSVLMKSMTLAKERMAELARFAADTPFELNEIVKSSRTLHVFSDGAMGAAESLKLVGDAASAIGQPIEELSFWVGRAYSMIKGGKPFGEAAMRLQEMGAITPQTRAEMEKLQASGASNIEVWGVLEKRLKEFDGGMNTLSKTGEGLTSTLKDTWTQAVREFGSAFSDSAKTGISAMIKALDDLNKSGAISSWGKATADAINGVISAFTALKNSYFGEIVGGATLAMFKAVFSPIQSIKDAIWRNTPEAQNADEQMFSDMLDEQQKQSNASQDKIAEDMAKAQKAPEKTKEQIEYDKQLEKFRIKLALEAEQEIYDNAIDSAKKTSEEVQKILEDQQKKKDEFAKKEQERYEKIADDANEAFKNAAEEQLAIAQKQGDAEIAIAKAIANAKDRMAQNAKKGRIGDNIDAIQQERQKRIDDSKDNDRTEKRAKSLRSLKSLSKEQAGWLAEFDRQQALRNMGAPGGREQDQIKAIQESLTTQKKMLTQLEQINKQTAESLRVN